MVLDFWKQPPLLVLNWRLQKRGRVTGLFLFTHYESVVSISYLST